MNIANDKIEEVISHFKITGTLLNIKANREGHINSTFISTFEAGGIIKKYTHQRINTHVFKHPFEVMENINAITSHIRKKLIKENCEVTKRCLQVVKTKDNTLLFVDKVGGHWRTYHFIDDVKTFSTIENEEQAKLLGHAVGQFQLYLSDFDGTTLHETIPHFHDMTLRYKQLEKAKKVNFNNRIEMVKEELHFLEVNKERGQRLWQSMERGLLPVRVTHNDTKMNNVLFSLDGKEALCVIDLDTVMPGTILFDTGDMIRTATNRAAEDETDLNKVECDVALHKALIQGYLSKALFLTPSEKELVVESGRNITQIMAVRFLSDYLNGDIYYHIEREDHNIIRARTQIKLIQDMDKKWDILTHIEN
ncbi:MAG: aminoglycoside phosphotransferase family protein [Spirochaetia bacterium]|nr:aminoglycoside phosphotransferase family protein [Spirochaetia bacterium]